MKVVVPEGNLRFRFLECIVYLPDKAPELQQQTSLDILAISRNASPSMLIEVKDPSNPNAQHQDAIRSISNMLTSEFRDRQIRDATMNTLTLADLHAVETGNCLLLLLIGSERFTEYNLNFQLVRNQLRLNMQQVLLSTPLLQRVTAGTVVDLAEYNGLMSPSGHSVWRHSTCTS
ncbi:MAG: hypothetical protein R3F46_04945 [bacterium]